MNSKRWIVGRGAALVALSVAAGLCLGGSCTVSWDGAGGSTTAPLSDADAEITISRSVGAIQASVVATITDAGRTVSLSADQEVRVNDVALAGPTLGQYTATISSAALYTVAVQDPTRGEEYTSLAPPTDFDIVSPTAGGGASLSGFTLTWSNVSDQAQVEITLTQTLAGAVETEVYGPFSDTGSRTLTASDLRDFRQGANLTITLAKWHTGNSIAGFGSGQLVVETTVSRTVQPLP